MALDLESLGLSATVTAEGISAPDYQTILSTVTGKGHLLPFLLDMFLPGMT